jgi:hypothetical protein
VLCGQKLVTAKFTKDRQEREGTILNLYHQAHSWKPEPSICVDNARFSGETPLNYSKWTTTVVYLRGRHSPGDGER